MAADMFGLEQAPPRNLDRKEAAALREAKPELLALLASAGLEQPAINPTRNCARCRHLTRIRTCPEPAAAGLDPPPGHRPGADWLGIRWPPDGYGDTCASYRDEPAPAAQECLYGPSAANADT